jgi:hypothetical protein
MDMAPICREFDAAKLKDSNVDLFLSSWDK